MIKEPIKIFDGTSVDATVASPHFHVGKEQFACMTAVISGGGSPAGVLSIQGTCDLNPSASSVWKDIGSTVAVSDDGSFRVPVGPFGDYAIRAAYTRTSGTGVITAYIFAK